MKELLSSKHRSYTLPALSEKSMLLVGSFESARTGKLRAAHHLRNKTEQERRGLPLEQMRTPIWLSNTLNSTSDTLQLLSMKSMLPGVFCRGWGGTMFEQQNLSTSADCKRANRQPILHFCGGEDFKFTQTPASTKQLCP